MKVAPDRPAPDPENGSSPRAPRWHGPVPLALFCGGLYLILCSLYIWLSGKLASSLAENVISLYKIELLKGLLFVLISTSIFTLAIYFLLRRVARTERMLREQRAVLEMFQQRASASLLASSIAHDMNNLLMVLQASVMKLDETESGTPEAREELSALQQSTDELISLAQRLQSSATASTPKDLREVNLAKLIKETVQLARRHPRARGTEIETGGVDSISIWGNAIVLRQMLLNLLLNAIDAVPNSSRGRVRLVLQLDADRKSAILEVHDNGSGVPEHERELIFSPYYTTKESGTGLGLLSVKAGAKAHNGNIIVRSSPLGGACFQLTLPLR